MTRRKQTALPSKNPATGRWDFVLDAGTDEEGRRRQIRRRGFATRREAQAELDRLRSDLLADAFVPPAKQSVADFLIDDWLPIRRGAVSPSTQAGDESKVRLYVVPNIGHRRLQALDAGVLNRLYADLLDHGGHDGRPLSPRTVRMVHTLLHRALGDAVKWDRLSRNVAALATPPRAVDARPPEMKTWTAAQLSDFLRAEQGTRYHPAFIFLATTGTRRSECLGLRWSDVDLDASRVSIRQTITLAANKVIVSPGTKTKSAHVISLDQGTVRALRSWRKAQTAERLLLEDHYQENDLVFCLPDGRPYHPDRFSREFKRRQLRHAAGPEIRLHDLRHTWATLALLSGVHPKVVQERLGHSSISITLDLYSHVTEPMKTDAADRVASQFLGA